ncbi:hypothetical protein HPB49_001922 [Dermacentor silvarum]|uniref:Uncharacterized protein n=1 Tax=Dermacentor silvarum TaxID=543639 RepID=A0ACB8CJ86_DERSI|nr:hypothetical protein HPB49_001922 [Dermacentor silvarum]
MSFAESRITDLTTRVSGLMSPTSSSTGLGTSLSEFRHAEMSGLNLPQPTLPTVTALHSWSSHHKAQILVAQLRSAAEFLEFLPASDRSYYASLVSALESRYGDAHLQHLHLTELQNLQQGHNILQELAAHIERSSRKALASCPHSTTDFIAPKAFINAITFNASSTSPGRLQFTPP